MDLAISLVVRVGAQWIWPSVWSLGLELSGFGHQFGR